MIGVDEVGRGAWAGPLLVVASRQKSATTVACRDSKRLSKNKRELLFDSLLKHYSFGEGWVLNTEIDKFGLGKAMALGVQRALANLGANIDDKIIIDGKVNYCGLKYSNAQNLIKADDTINEVSVASVYAKVRRDRLMIELSRRYIYYDLENNVGYGTKKHQLGLDMFGVSKIHRRSFSPIKKRLK